MNRIVDWWSRRARWQKIVLVIVGVSVVAAPFTDSEDEEGGPDDVAPIAASTSDAPSTTELAATTTATTTSTPAPETTITDAATTSTAPPTTTSQILIRDEVVEVATDLLNKLPVVAQFAPETPYNRDTYEGSTSDPDGDCFTTRENVLIDESMVEATLDGCDVAAGEWTDMWSGETFTDPSLGTTDHHVPLAHAHRAGAWRWDEPTRQAFTHDLGHPSVLNIVLGGTNQSKADRGPDQWRPPSEAAWCAYAIDWVLAKWRWSLEVTSDEVTALTEMLDTCDEDSARRWVDAGPATLAPVVTTLPPPTTTTTIVVSDEGSVEIASCQRREERVIIVNTGSTAISVRSWRLHDEGDKHSYRFGSVTIEPGGTIIVMTGPDNVADDPNEILWKRQHVWNNDGDTAFLLDDAGDLVDERRCG